MKLRICNLKTAAQSPIVKATSVFLAHPLHESARFCGIAWRYAKLHKKEKRFLDAAEAYDKKALAVDNTLGNLKAMKTAGVNYMLAADARQKAWKLRLKINPRAVPRQRDKYGSIDEHGISSEWALAVYSFAEAIRLGKSIIERLGSEGKPRAPMLEHVAATRELLADCFTKLGGDDGVQNAARQLEIAKEMRAEADNEKKMQSF
ncbi:MAG: hypothetical protein WC488_04170 [Candidatus Micrarchaeia archaeon]